MMKVVRSSAGTTGTHSRALIPVWGYSRDVGDRYTGWSIATSSTGSSGTNRHTIAAIFSTNPSNSAVFSRLNATLDAGGAISIPKASTWLTAKQDNLVQVGAARILADGALDIYTRSNADMSTKVRAITYGLAGAAQGSSHAEFTTDDIHTP